MAACLRCQSASVNYHPQRGWRGLGDPGRDLPLPEIELISKPVLLQLPTDVLPDLILIESNRAHTVAARPEVATPPLPQAPLSRRAGAGRRGPFRHPRSGLPRHTSPSLQLSQWIEFF